MKNLAGTGTTGPTKLLPGTPGPTKLSDSEAWLRDLQKQIDTLGDLDWKPPTVDPVVVDEDPVDAWRKRGIELGVIDADFTLPTRAGSENSHTPDTSLATRVN